MLRVFTAVILICLSGTLLAGCGGGPKDQGTVTKGDSIQPPAKAQLPETLSKLPQYTVAEVLDGLVSEGTRITVTGRYLGYGAQQAFGPQPLTRSDWQLADGPDAIWVTGQMPKGTAPLEAGHAPITIAARVDMDQVSSLSDSGQKDRWFLVLIDP